MLVLIQTGIFAQNRAHIDSINAIDDITVFSNIEESISVFKQNADEAQTLGYPLGEARAYRHLGMAQYLSGQYAQSVESYLTAIRIFESMNATKELVTAYSELGYQMKRRDLKRGLHYMKTAMQMAESKGLRSYLTAIYDNYGVLQEMNGQLDSARFFYTKALDLKLELGDSLGVPYSLNNLSGLFALKKDYAKSRKYLEESDRFREKNSDAFGKLYNLVLWGDLYRGMGKPDSAIAKYTQVINAPLAFEHKYQMSYCFEQLADLYQQKNDFENAYQNLKQYQAYRDSLVNYETNSQIAKLQIEYETEKKDRELAEEKLKLDHRNSMLIISALILLLLVVLVIGVYQFYRQEIKRINHQMEIDEQIKRVQYQQKISEEKLRISRELHDNIGSQLTFLISSLDNLSFLINDRPNIRKKIKNLSIFGRNTMNELRNTIWAMRSKEASLETLVLKLNQISLQFRESFESIKMEIINNCTETIPLTSIQMINLFRVAQEAFQNALKHSACTRIRIQFDVMDGQLIMKIRDNGNGFDPENGKRGNGLENMSRRCEQIGGSFSVTSNSTGTEILCRLGIN
ncbi:MAG: hypothetical protein GXO90_00530 [FCB group bacterium]|nr:hypothetical protein [FCB group bacterium]